MAFSSPVFLFLFLPVFLVLYFCTPARWKNAAVLGFSLAFYFSDANYAFWVLVLSIPFNHVIGQALAAQRDKPHARWLLIFGVGANLLPLLIYKYFGFMGEAANDVLNFGHVPFHIAAVKLILPAGISFFTFQGLSYLVDIYRGTIEPAPTMVDFGMYHTLFPQLIAGPIVRYDDIKDEIVTRPSKLADVHEGLMRFSFGLAKKVVLADTIGSIADHVWQLPARQLDGELAWLGAFAYALQIFFDFSGYSDMAIGLGRVMGFHFPENFDQPYRAHNFTEFWRRWHMTLSRWFRDYVYIPLGGNRDGSARTYVNLLIVFILCGLWHGAAYTFLFWGLYHGFFLAGERWLKHRYNFAPSNIAAQIVTFILLILGWVLFRSETMADAGLHYAAMLGLHHGSDIFLDTKFFMTPDRILYLTIALTLAFFPFERYQTMPANRAGIAIKSLFALLCFAYAITLTAANGFNNFIYFRF